MVNVVNLNVPFFNGLATMTKYKMYVDMVRDQLCLPYLRLEFYLNRKNGDSYYEWNRTETILFNRGELVKLN